MTTTGIVLGCAGGRGVQALQGNPAIDHVASLDTVHRPAYVPHGSRQGKTLGASRLQDVQRGVDSGDSDSHIGSELGGSDLRRNVGQYRDIFGSEDRDEEQRDRAPNENESSVVPGRGLNQFCDQFADSLAGAEHSRESSEDLSFFSESQDPVVGWVSCRVQGGDSGEEP